MSTFTSRGYAGAHDLDGALALLREQRAAANSERYPTVWRLELLLSSRLWEPARDARFWVDKARQIVAFAALTSRQREASGAGLERIFHPSARDAALDDAIVQWALDRALERALERGEPLTLGAVSFADDPTLTDSLKRNGFRLHEGYNVYLARSLDAPLPEPALPEGFTENGVRKPPDLSRGMKDPLPLPVSFPRGRIA
ncbi:MAG TPA: hypothetical protein VGS80_10795, partial [Ktedonobacterales bacterium]|nr:hypothetical protein [Ktedonobacterales bacterium]